MASSSALTLVNKIVSTTADYTQDLTTIASSPGGLGTRILNFLNLVINEVAEVIPNHPALRVNAQGTADGVTGIMEWSGSEDVRCEGAVSVYVPTYTQDPLEEVTPQHFNQIVSANVYSGSPAVFQRGVSTSGKLEVQLYPVPASGDIVDVTAYKRPTFLSADTDTTEFDDHILVIGTLAHVDAFDGLDRGYVQKFEQAKRQLYQRVFGNTTYRTRTEDYH